MSAPLDFWFDFASPYGYLASTQIDDIAARHGRTVRWRPILLGAVFKVSGMKPVMDQPLRGEYLIHDVPRFARLLGVPLTMPAKVPLQRAGGVPGLLVAGAVGPGKGACAGQGDLPCALGGGTRCRATEQVAEVAAPLGIPAADLIAGVQEPMVKDRLRAETDEAIRRGVFGAPFIQIDGKSFWGADRLDQIDQWLARGGW